MNILPPLKTRGVGSIKTVGHTRNVGEIHLITDPKSVISQSLLWSPIRLVKRNLVGFHLRTESVKRMELENCVTKEAAIYSSNFLETSRRVVGPDSWSVFGDYQTKYEFQPPRLHLFCTDFLFSWLCFKKITSAFQWSLGCSSLYHFISSSNYHN